MQQSTAKVTSMAKNVVATTARAGETMKVARVMAAGATRMVATTVATAASMTQNVDEDNKDGNSKNNNKVTATLTATTTTEGGSVLNLAEIIIAEDIVIPGTPPLHPRLPHHDTLLLDLFFPERGLYSLLCMGINRKSG
jgi:hypothetical protein